MRRIAYMSLAALSIVGAMTSQAWAPPTGVLTPNIGALTPNIGALTPNIGALTPNIGALTPNVGALSPNVGALTPPAARINVPDLPGGNYGGLPNFRQLDVPIYDAPTSPLRGLDPPTINYGNLAPDAPRLNYGVLQPEAPNAPMGRLPDNPAGAAPRYDIVPTDPTARPLPNRPMNYGALTPEAPNAPMGRLPDRPLPLAYGELPSGPSGTPIKQKPADALADLVNLPDNHPGRIQANRITNNVGVPNPPTRTPVRNVQNLPSPQQMVPDPPPTPPTGYWSRLNTAQKRVIIGTGAIVGFTIAVTAIGISMPTIIEKVTGEEIADTGNPDVDELVDALTDTP